MSQLDISALEVVVGAGLYFSLLWSREKRLEVRMVPSIWSRAVLTLRPHTYTDNDSGICRDTAQNSSPQNYKNI